MWIFSAIASAIAAGVVFVLATAGLLVALVVGLILFLVLGFVIRRNIRKNATVYEQNGTKIFFYSNIPGAGQPNREQKQEGVYELSPEDYSISDELPEDSPGPQDKTAPQDRPAGEEQPSLPAGSGDAPRPNDR